MPRSLPPGPRDGPLGWKTRPAIHGRGELLVGPADEDIAGGVHVFAPPGVLLRTCRDDPPLSRDDWRMARWLRDVNGQLLIDQVRPARSRSITLRRAVAEIAQRSPEHLGWVAEIVERQLRLRVGRMAAHDHAGRMHPSAPTAYGNLTRLRDEAESAFQEAAALVGSRVAYLRPGHFADLLSGGYIAFMHGRQQLARAHRGPDEPHPPARHSTLRYLFKDDEDDRPRPRALE